jgi:predicted nucleotide-binding protein
VNVLEDMGVPREKAPEVLDRLEASARAVGFLQTIKEKTWVFLGTTNAIVPEGEDRAAGEMSADESQQHAIAASTLTSVTPTPTPPVAPVAPALPVDTSQNTTLAAAVADDARRRKVFVTHGKDRALVDPIKRLLEFGELEPVVSVERSTVSKPVPEKVMDDMRMAGAAIIHVDAERALKDGDGNDHLMINPNVLIEIGAAMAFYGRRFILLVREGVALPSNLQGLFEVRYKDDTLDADATIRLLEAIREMKALPLPNSIGL